VVGFPGFLFFGFCFCLTGLLFRYPVHLRHTVFVSVVLMGLDVPLFSVLISSRSPISFAAPSGNGVFFGLLPSDCRVRGEFSACFLYLISLFILFSEVRSEGNLCDSWGM